MIAHSPYLSAAPLNMLARVAVMRAEADTLASYKTPGAIRRAILLHNAASRLAILANDQRRIS